MPLLGCRVVRGPDWKWGEQDGGEGSVGTIINLDNFADGRPLPARAVLVCWDAGFIADYRVGLDGFSDLRVLDSAPAGIAHSIFTCNGCLTSNITGMRWHCTKCVDYDLCNVCYMNDVDDKNHPYERFDLPNDRNNGVNVGPRSKAKKVQAKGLFPGAQVVRGHDWYLDLELGDHNGHVVGIKANEGVARSAVSVKWGQSLEIIHRAGYQGKVDVQMIAPGQNGPFYYKEHLQVITSPVELKRFASTGGVKLNEGDRVTIHLEEDTLKLMSQGHGGWVSGMEKAIGKVGTIKKIDEDGDVHVSFGLMRWAFHPEALIKVCDLRPGDKVRVLDSKQLVMKYQDGHGGWNNAMEAALNKQGKVLRVDKDGDAIVEVAGQRWLFNSAALVLESKEDERQPPGERIGNETVNPLEALVDALFQTLTSQVEGAGIEQLVLASTLGDRDTVKKIIENNKSLLNQKSAGQKTALHVACHQGNPEVVSYLLQQGADKDIRDEGGYTALHHAAYGDKSGECVVMMLSANANVNVIDGDEKTKSTPLHLAIQQDNEKAVIALTNSRHCDLNLQDKVGDTPLHSTILLNRTTSAKIILDNCKERLDPSLFNERGFNVLHLACIKNCTEVARILIEQYPGLIDMVKEDGFAPLHLAALNNRCEIARMIILSGHCNINQKNKDGRTALSIAVGESYKNMIELLVQHGVDINLEDEDGDTPLHLAVMKHCMTFFGLDLNELLGKPSSPDATKSVNLAIAVFLVAQGADINHRNHQFKTPIDLCIDQRTKNMLTNSAMGSRPTGSTVQPGTTAIPRQAVSQSNNSQTFHATNTQARPTGNLLTNMPTSPSFNSPTDAPTSPEFDLLTKPPNNQPTSPQTNPLSPPSKLVTKPPILPRTILPTIQPTSSRQNKPNPPPKPTTEPQTNQPTSSPTSTPTNQPSSQLTNKTTSPPTKPPIPPRTILPTNQPTSSRQNKPNPPPKPTTKSQTNQTTSSPTFTPTNQPTCQPTNQLTIQSTSSTTNQLARSPAKPQSVKSAATLDPTSSQAAIPASLAKGECRGSNSDNPELTGKQTNNQISSQIRATDQAIVQGQNRNLQAEQCALCRYCEEEPATVVFEPCQHTVVCETCSFRAKKCLECKCVITGKSSGPGEQPYRSLTDFKKNYEKQCRELRKQVEDMERITTCQICMERPSNVVFSKCGHKVCQICSRRLTKCHICQRDITSEEKIVTYQ